MSKLASRSVFGSLLRGGMGVEFAKIEDMFRLMERPWRRGSSGSGLTWELDMNPDRTEASGWPHWPHGGIVPASLVRFCVPIIYHQRDISSSTAHALVSMYSSSP